MINLEKGFVYYLKEYTTMKKLFLLMSLGLFISCSSVQNPDYERNLEIRKNGLKLLVMKTLTIRCLILLMKLNIKVLFMGAL